MSVSSGVDGRGQEGDEFHQFCLDGQYKPVQQNRLSSGLFEIRNQEIESSLEGIIQEPCRRSQQS